MKNKMQLMENEAYLFNEETDRCVAVFDHMGGAIRGFYHANSCTVLNVFSDKLHIRFYLNGVSNAVIFAKGFKFKSENDLEVYLEATD